MAAKHDQQLINAIRGSAHPLAGDTTDFDPLLKAVGDSRFVLIRRSVARHARVLPCARADN
jgi:hypothetical protein